MTNRRSIPRGAQTQLVVIVLVGKEAGDLFLALVGREVLGLFLRALVELTAVGPPYKYL